MKILKPKNILSIIYCILLSAPFLSIAVRCGYTMINKNAYQSYSNNGIIEQTEKIASTGNLSEGLQYNAYLDTSLGVATNMSSIYRYSEISIDWTEYGAPAPNNYTGFAFYKTDDNVNNEYYVFLYVDDDDQREYTFWSGNNTFGQNLQFSFIPSQTIVQNGYQILNIYTNTFGKQTLDNVFDYSVNKFIEDNNIGQIDLTSWFSNLFLSNQSVNVQYINFLNWYLNYAILVSCVNILFLVLMWFVNFARRLLEKSMNAGYDW